MLDVVTSRAPERRRPRLLLLGAATFWMFAGGNLASVGLNALATIVTFLGAVILLPCALSRVPVDHARLEPVNPWRARLPLPLWGFAAYVALSAVHQQTEVGTQNALVYLSFVSIMSLAAAWTSAASPLMLLRSIRAAAGIGALGYLVTVFFNGAGSGGFYAARVYGEIVWVGMAAAVPLAKQSRWGYVVPLLLLSASLLSLSRTATAVCALMFLSLAAIGHGRRGLFRVVPLAAVMAFSAFVLLTQYEPLRNRFMQNDNEAIAGVRVGTTGRSRMWSIVWESIRESPWLGHGIGDAERLITFYMPQVTHPHNDYLRLWNDLGIVGLGLWVAAVLMLMGGAGRRWRVATNNADRAVHQAALFSLAGLSLNTLTSNSLVYIFVLVPVAVVVGTSLGRATMRQPNAVGEPEGFGASRATGHGGRVPGREGPRSVGPRPRGHVVTSRQLT